MADYISWYISAHWKVRLITLDKNRDMLRSIMHSGNAG